MVLQKCLSGGFWFILFSLISQRGTKHSEEPLVKVAPCSGLSAAAEWPVVIYHSLSRRLSAARQPASFYIFITTSHIWDREQTES